MICTNANCEDTATRIMALPMEGAVFVAPYCDIHTIEVEQQGGVAACGPALSAEASKIEGIR